MNHTDEQPSRVTLPRGSYIVQAWSETMGAVSVPVVIRTAHMTVLHLERPKDWREPALVGRPRLFVHLPNGQPIGWKAVRR